MNAITPGFRKTLGYSVLGALVVYIAVSLWLIASPASVLFNRKLSRYYRWATLPGPFFKDKRIYTPGHFYVSYKKIQGDWEPFRNPEADRVGQYRERFFDYNSLQQARTAHFMGRALYSTWRKKPESIVQSKAFRQMHAHLRRGYIPGDADSVKMLYLGEGMSHNAEQYDTLFQFTYKSY